MTPIIWNLTLKYDERFGVPGLQAAKRENKKE